jgi:hypothetical protein
MLPDFAQSLYERFEREGISLLLAGGWAVCHHGYTRFTNDIDWICSRADEDRANALMESLHFEIAFQSMATRFQMKDHLEIPPVDLIWVSPETFVKLSTSPQRTGRHHNIPVIDFEALLAMKLHALKDDTERKGKDVLDIRFLLAENPDAIPEERLRALCERYAGPDAYHFIRMIP